MSYEQLDWPGITQIGLKLTMVFGPLTVIGIIVWALLYSFYIVYIKENRGTPKHKTEDKNAKTEE